MLPKNQYLVSELRVNFTESVYVSIVKIESNGIRNTKYEGIKSGHILLISPFFCRKKTATGQQYDDILGVKTRWIRKQKSDKKGVFFRKVNYRVGQTMRQNRNMFRAKGMCDK